MVVLYKHLLQKTLEWMRKKRRVNFHPSKIKEIKGISIRSDTNATLNSEDNAMNHKASNALRLSRETNQYHRNIARLL